MGARKGPMNRKGNLMPKAIYNILFSFFLYSIMGAQVHAKNKCLEKCKEESDVCDYFPGQACWDCISKCERNTK